MEKLTREQVIEKLKKGNKDFSNLDLSNCNLSHCNLYHCDLSNTNLSFANLDNAILSYANLSNAILSYVYLFSANLSYANLDNVDLSNAILSQCDLFNAKLDEKEQIRKGLILKESMIGYKKCIDDIIVTLEIPKGAIVFSINNNSCRTNKAKVIEISDDKKIAYSYYDNSFTYELGKKIEIEDFDLSYNVECTTGIHFYRTKEEAEKY